MEHASGEEQWRFDVGFSIIGVEKDFRAGCWMQLWDWRKVGFGEGFGVDEHAEAVGEDSWVQVGLDVFVEGSGEGVCWDGFGYDL